jgi:hypothetical protein
MTKHWYDDHRNLAAVAHTMLDSSDTPYDASDVLYMLEKPWKFEDVFTETVTPAQEEKLTPAQELAIWAKTLTFAKGDRVRDRLNPTRTGTATIGSSPTQPTAGVVVHWDGMGPDHLVVVDPADLRKIAAHVPGEPYKVRHPGGKDGMFRVDCSCGDYSTSFYATPESATRYARQHADARNGAK